MELNNITNTGTWGQQVTRLNDNFNKVALWIDTLQEMYESLSQSAIEVVDTLPSTGKANKIYRLVGTTSYSDYMYNTDDLNTPILMATYNNAIENEPTPGSNNLVKSGGIASNIVFDISAYHATGSTLATYADLTSALGTNGANVPSEVRKGGMSIKFVQTYDNKYVQYRLMSDTFNTTVTNWQGVDDVPTAGSDNLVKSGGIVSMYGSYIENSEFVRLYLDQNKKILWGIQRDGNIYFGAGVPRQIRAFILSMVSKVDRNDDVDSILDFLNGFENEENLKNYLEAIYGKYEENAEFLNIERDANNKIIEANRKNGVKYLPAGLETSKVNIGGGNVISASRDKEYRLCIERDYFGRIVSYRKADGTKVELAGLEVNSIIDKSPFDYFPINKYMPIMANLKRREIIRNSGVMGDYETFTLACLTDTHADDDAVINFINFRKKYAEYIDDAYINGDLIVDNFTKPYTHQNINGYDKILLGIGNHDVYTANWHSLSDVVSEQDAYDRYFANDIAKWCVTYMQGKTYYYKDYPRAKVRFVVLDCMYWDSTQKTWFTNVLGDTINSSNSAYGYHVIVAQHIPNAHDSGKLLPFDCSFNSKDDISVYHCAYYDSVEIVDDFINQGGQFITWIFGHWHADFVGTLADYPNQMFIVQNVSNGTYNEQQGWTDTARIENTESRNQFNVYSVDTTKKYLRIARIGAEYDRNLQHKGTLLLSYDSENIKVLANY